MRVEDRPVTRPVERTSRVNRLEQVDASFPRALPMLVLALLLVALNVQTTRQISQVAEGDERDHIDYLIRGSHGRIGQNGDMMTQETLREFCQRGAEPFPWPPCTPGKLDPGDFAVGGVNSTSHTPFYYLSTGLTARVLRALTPGWESIVTWGRVLGSAWLLFGCYLALRAGEMLGIRRWPLVAGIGMVALVPVQLEAFTTVNPDATAFASGAGVLLGAFIWERRRKGLWLLASVAGLAVALDAPNAVGLLVVAGYLAFRGASSIAGIASNGLLPWRQYVLAGTAMLVGAVIAMGAWELASRQLSSLPRENVVDAVEYEDGTTLDPLRVAYDNNIRFDRIFGPDSIFAMFPPVNDITPPAVRSVDNAPWYRLFWTAALFLIVGALLLPILRMSGTSRIQALGLASVSALLIAPPLLQLYHQIIDDYFEPVVPRLGLSALPAIALLLGALARERIVLTLVAVLAGGLYVTAFLTVA